MPRVVRRASSARRRPRAVRDVPVAARARQGVRRRRQVPHHAAHASRHRIDTAVGGFEDGVGTRERDFGDFVGDLVRRGRRFDARGGGVIFDAFARAGLIPALVNAIRDLNAAANEERGVGPGRKATNDTEKSSRKSQSLRPACTGRGWPISCSTRRVRGTTAAARRRGPRCASFRRCTACSRSRGPRCQVHVGQAVTGRRPPGEGRRLQGRHAARGSGAQAGSILAVGGSGDEGGGVAGSV